MASTWQQPISLSPPRTRIRVVLADFDRTRRSVIRRALLANVGYEVVAEAESADELARLVSIEGPELVVASLPLFLDADSAKQPFPLCIALGGMSIARERYIATLDEPVCESNVAEALEAATVRILTAKAGELSTLIRQYVLHSDTGAGLSGEFSVEHEGRPVVLRAESIRWIKAAGNYVEFYTGAGVYDMRESMRNVVARLERLGFVRIHRGIVVNAATIRYRVVQHEVCVGIVLDDGTQLQVGPNYRDQVPLHVPVLPPMTVI